MSSYDWYFGVGTEHGPVPREELVRLLAEGPLGPGTLVWHESLRDWTPARDVPDLADPDGPRESAFSIEYALSQCWELSSGRLGLLIAVPFAGMAQAFVYRALLARAERGHVAGVVSAW